MRIAAGQTAYLAGAGLAGAAARPGGARFSLGSDGPARTGAPRSAAPLATLDAILALQGGEEDPRERRRRGARRGQEILAALDGLKVALLAGEVSPAALRDIADRLARGPGPTGDPGLDEVVASIELRAQVELAKLAGRVG